MTLGTIRFRCLMTPAWAFIAISLACSHAQPATPEAEWRQWRGDSRDGCAVVSPPLRTSLPETGLEPVWQSETIGSGGGGGWGSPVVADGRVYLFVHTKTQQGEGAPPPKKFPWLPPDKREGMSDAEYEAYEVQRREEDEALAAFYQFQEIVYCLDLATGETLWSNRADSVYTRFLQSGTPAVYDGRLYILGAGRRARCIDAATGTDIWTTRLPGEFRDEYMMSSFALADGVALLLASHAFALDAGTGEIIWEGDAHETSGTHSSAVVWNSPQGARFVMNCGGGSTVCFEPRTGREVWRLDTDATLSTPVVTGERLITYANSRRGGLRCYSLASEEPQLLWTYQRVADKGSSPVVANGCVYAQGERRLACVDLETGDEFWNELMDLATPQYTSLIAADGKVFYAHDGILWMAASTEGMEVLVAGKVNKEGLLATEEVHRRLLGLDELERQPDGLEQSLKVYQREIGSQGPLRCTSPAMVDGRLIVRFNNRLACYDLRAAQ